MLIFFVRRMQEQRRLHEEYEFNKTRPQRKIIKQLTKMKEEIIGLRKKLRSNTKLLELINHKGKGQKNAAKMAWRDGWDNHKNERQHN